MCDFALDQYTRMSSADPHDLLYFCTFVAVWSSVLVHLLDSENCSDPVLVRLNVRVIEAVSVYRY